VAVAATRRRAAAALLAAVFSMLCGDAPAEPSSVNSKVRGDVATYSDTNAVGVVTSSLGAAVENPTSGWSADGSYLVDIVSAASVDIVSTASRRWTELRHAGVLGATYKPGNVGATASGAVSREPDYFSRSGGARFTMDLANKSAMPSMAYSYTRDTAGRTGTPFSVFALELERHTVSAGIELVLDASTFLSFNADALFENGEQEKPYRFLPVFSPGIASTVQPGASLAAVNNVRLPGRMAENVPDDRHRFALSTRVARRLQGTTLILSERMYADSWGLRASTTDLRVVFDLSRRLELWGHLRGHVQSSVDFWNVAYAAVAATPDGAFGIPLFRSGDRELSALSTGTLGFGLRWKLTAPEKPFQITTGLQSDLLVTIFREALYLRNRLAYLNALDVQLEF
jgi:hypothetical protein